jgi:translation initiation factor IF-3
MSFLPRWKHDLAIKIKQLMLFWENENHVKHINAYVLVGRMQNFSRLKQVVYIEPLSFKGLISCQHNMRESQKIGQKQT